MEIKPVKTKKIPGYPLKEDIDNDTIKTCAPRRWEKSAAAKMALGALAAMTLAGCAPKNAQQVPVSPSNTNKLTLTVPGDLILDATPIGKYALDMINVAPLFLHGVGSGAFGCIMIAPPAFLSEEEALIVINETAKEYGLCFSNKDMPEFLNVTQPVTDMYGSKGPLPSGKNITFTPDFTDAEYGVSIEFVSTQDVSSWNCAQQTTPASSVDTKDAAAQLSEALKFATSAIIGENNAVAVFYDPCASAPTNADDPSFEADEQSHALAREQLAAQAKDFFEWLKEQGII